MFLMVPTAHIIVPFYNCQCRGSLLVLTAIWEGLLCRFSILVHGLSSYTVLQTYLNISASPSTNEETSRERLPSWKTSW